LVIQRGDAVQLQKLLAEPLWSTEARLAMSLLPRSPNRGRAFITVFISAAFLWTLALTVSPQLHERIHPDANRVEHTCAVTFIASGSYHHSAHPQIAASVVVSEFPKIPALTPRWVESPFLGARIFEHAPPARA
jgi:hypothetical protein